MPEREAALRKTLAELHAELEQAGPIDAALRADLEQALAEIRKAIERERRTGAARPLGEQLEALALRFEQTHPLITQSIAGVVRALGGMGI
jgi:uncharacterized membrane protein YccC